MPRPSWTWISQTDSQYEINFNAACDSGESLDKIRLALQDSAENISGFKTAAPIELKGGVELLSKYSRILRERADGMRQASICIKTAAENYSDAECLTYERLLDIDCPVDVEEFVGGETPGSGDDTSGGGGTTGIGGDIGGDSGHIEPPFDGSDKPNPEIVAPYIPPVHPHYPNRPEYPSSPFIPWQNIPYAKPDWCKLDDLLKWIYVWPLVLSIVDTGKSTPNEIWSLIKEIFNKNTDNGTKTDTSEDTSVNSGDNSQSGLSPNVTVGEGVINRPADGFAQAESGVGAQTGRGRTAINNLAAFSSYGAGSQSGGIVSAVLNGGAIQERS